MQYFAYGSNMLAAQMAERCPNATPGHTALISGWKFLINERGVATITPEPDSTVFGVLWKVGPGNVVALDGFEGVADGRYERRVLSVTPETHDPEPAIVYVDKRVTQGEPRPGYLEKILAGAQSFRLPDHYQDELKSWANPAV